MADKSFLKRVLAIVLFMGCSLLYSEGDTRYDAHMNLPFNEKAGNVNPQTGDISLSAVDLSLPGRGISFSFGRSWSLNQSSLFNMVWDNGNGLNSDTADKYSRIGTGWKSSVPFIQKTDNGDYSSAHLFLGGGAYQIDTANLDKKSGDVSNLIGYDLLDLIIFTDRGMSYGEAGSNKITALNTAYADLNISELQKSEYLLTLKDNSKLYFDVNGNLMMQQDSTGKNRIWYFYDGENRLKLVLDTLEREIEFSYSPEGNLIEIAWNVSYGSISGETRSQVQNERRTVKYHYTKAEVLFPAENWAGYKSSVTGYRDPWVLVSVQSPYDQIENQTGKMVQTETRYNYEAAASRFTYDTSLPEKENLHLLLKDISSGYSKTGETEKFLNRQIIDYAKPSNGRQRKGFYTGYMEVFKTARQSFRNRHNDRDLNTVEYTYIEAGEQGNYKSYQTVITAGDMENRYIYSTENSVLSSVQTKAEGFFQEKLYEYNQFRTKVKDVVKRDGEIIYTESFNFDKNGNLTWSRDKSGLEVSVTYYDKWSVPRFTTKKVTSEGTLKEYISENIIDSLGRVTEQVLYLGGGKTLSSKTVYDDVYGNVIQQIDPSGQVQYIEYDTLYNCFPVRNYFLNVEIPSWSKGFHTDWINEADGTSLITVQNLRKYNSDGTVWIEVDNDGFAIEHYYNVMGQEYRTVNPHGGDVKVTNLEDQAELDAFLLSRQGNPGAYMEIHYQDGLVKTYADLDKAQGTFMITGAQTDGLGNTESEIQYGEGGIEYKNLMTYDSYGRMIALTDADASPEFINTQIHGTKFQRHDKTWLITYDALNRQKKVYYPVTTEDGVPGDKEITYDDRHNIITTRDPEGRTTVQEMDWAGNLVKLTQKGDHNTKESDYLIYTYEYDEAGRKTLFTDPKGIRTGYLYDERNLLIEQRFYTDSADGISRSDFMTYDERGMLISKTDRKGQIAAFFYDSLGRNTEVRNYLSAEDQTNSIVHSQVRTAYDKRGNAVRIDNDNLIEYYQYDFGNRVTSLKRTLKDSLTDIKTSVAGVWGGTPSDQVFSFTYEYNDGGLVQKMIYPDGSEHTYSYDNSLARLQGISEKAIADLNPNPFVTSLNYTNSGVVTDMSYSNGVTQYWEFDNRKRIKNLSIIHTDNTDIQNPVITTLEDLVYSLNKNGDILSINENEYTYDGFNRITGAKTLLPESKGDPLKLVKESFGTYKDNPPLEVNGVLREYNPDADRNQPTVDNRINGLDLILATLEKIDSLYDIESFEYDKNGNRTRLEQNGDIYTYQYGERNRLLSVSLQKKGEQFKKEFIRYTYDDNGNQTKREILRDEGTETILFIYDTLNRLIETQEDGKSTKYFYDNAGNRFIKQAHDGETTLYLRHGQIAVAMDIEIPGSTKEFKVGEEYKGKIIRYVMSGDLTAGKITRTVKSDSTEIINKSFYHLDHLNSTKMVTDETGAIEANYTYRAFGEQLNDLQEKDAKYTYGGKELDSNTNLYYFNARFYDATIGRFINVDPIQDGTNWYVYCSNNPLSFIDPTGLRPKDMVNDALAFRHASDDVVNDTSLSTSTDSVQSVDTDENPFIINKKAGFVLTPGGGNPVKGHAINPHIKGEAWYNNNSTGFELEASTGGATTGEQTLLKFSESTSLSGEAKIDAIKGKVGLNITNGKPGFEAHAALLEAEGMVRMNIFNINIDIKASGSLASIGAKIDFSKGIAIKGAFGIGGGLAVELTNDDAKGTVKVK